MDEKFSIRAKLLVNDYLLKTEKLFISSKDNWINDFIEHFITACSIIAKKQDELCIPAISYLEYTLLLTNIINRHYVSEIIVYNDKSYLDLKQHIVYKYDISHLLVYFDDLWNKLLNERKLYVGKVRSNDVTKIMLESCFSFYSYLISIARYAIKHCIGIYPFIDILRNKVFMINVGNYMAKTEPVYIENKQKDNKRLETWFNEKKANEYIFGDYSKLCFIAKNFSYTDFRYSSFNGSVLKKTHFSGSELIGVNFSQADLEDCIFDYCTIYEADFSNANMKNASLVKTTAKPGLTNEII
jgi:hypothetical protein